MAAKQDSEPALEAIEAVGPDETTEADGDWPVPPAFQVTPDEDGVGVVPARPEEAAEGVVTTPPRSRRPELSVAAGLLGALLAALLVLGIAGFASWGDRRSTSEQSSLSAKKTGKKTKAAPAVASVPVPDVSKLDVTRARGILQEVGLRTRIRIPTGAAKVDGSGQVQRQTPAPGSEVAVGSVVVLTVSDTRPSIEVPEVVGLMASDATRALHDANLRTEIRLVRSAKPVGIVLGQAPSPGTKLAGESVVRLQVARASRPVTIAVPRVIGSTAAEAKSRLRALGLRWTVSPVESREVEGTVVGQSPGAGTRLRKGQTITLETSTGPAQVTVPDVIGLDERSARAQLEAVGLAVKVDDEVTTDASQDGIVVGQTPIGGSMSDVAGAVTITVARLVAETSP